MAGKRGLGAGIDTLIPKRKESDSNTKTEEEMSHLGTHVALRDVSLCDI